MTKDSVNHSPHHQTSEHNVTQPTENYTSEDDKEDHTPTITGDEQADNSSCSHEVWGEGSSHSCSEAQNGPAEDSDSDSDYDMWDGSRVVQLLPTGYEYKNCVCRRVDNSESFEAEFKVNILEKEVKEWVREYNKKTKQTMVFGRKKLQKGKRVSTKYFLHCHHRQRQTGKHQKSDRVLKTAIREHSIKHTNCPAKMNISVHAAIHYL